MKTSLFLLSLASSVIGQTIIPHPISFSMYSEVDRIDTGFVYNYYVDRGAVMQDISHFEIYVCKDAEILNASANVSFKIDGSDGVFVFDSIPSNTQPDMFHFWFESPNVPVDGQVMAKVATTQYYNYNPVSVPSCQIVPEPNTGFLGVLGTLILFRRNRKV